jgi:hypothetical protein
MGRYDGLQIPSPWPIPVYILSPTEISSYGTQMSSSISPIRFAQTHHCSWNRWNANEYNQITAELKKIEVVAESILSTASERPPRSFFSKTCYPILSKAWC